MNTTQKASTIFNKQLSPIDTILDSIEYIIEQYRLASLVHFCNTGKFLNEV